MGVAGSPLTVLRLVLGFLVRLAGPVDLLLTVTNDRVQLTGSGIDVTADHGGVRPGLTEAVNETRRSRDRMSLPVRSETQTQLAV
jgi:hypothetical protein